jgi:phosphate-selective porin
MNIHSVKMLSLLASFAVLGSLTAQAQDKATLDLLVKKGVISQSDADGVAKSSASAAMVTTKDPSVKSLKLESLFQSQFDWLTTNDKAAGASNPPSTGQFFIRRAYLGAIADMGNGWTGEIFFDFAAGTGANGGGQGGTARNNFEKIIISKKLDDLYGTITTGYQKVNFTLEEVTSSAAVKPIERSVLTRYIDEQYNGGSTTQRLGFANQHAGVFWDGKVADTGFTYGAAVTSTEQNSVSYGAVGGYNRLGAWVNGAYANTLMDGDLGYKAGVNFGIEPGGNSVPAPGQGNAMWGYNPFITLTYKKDFQLDAEFLQVSVQRGRGPAGAATAQRAMPYGFNITPSYMITPEWELVARYSMLNTNGRGTNIADVARNASNIGATVFDSVDSYYVGVNWYISKNAVKFSLGYEYDEFSGRGTASTPSSFTGPRATVDGFRARMQVSF